MVKTQAKKDIVNKYECNVKNSSDNVRTPGKKNINSILKTARRKPTVKKRVRFLIQNIELSAETVTNHENMRPNEGCTNSSPVDAETMYKKTANINKKNKNVYKMIKFLYSNANGIKSKMSSLKSAVECNGSHIVAITETKISTGNPPKLDNFTWNTKNRANKKGGGVAIAVRNDIVQYSSPVGNIEVYNQEIEWIQLKTLNNTVIIGCYYGLQENAPIENVEQEFQKLTTQVLQLKRKGEIILSGDFNAKLKIIRNGNTIQDESRNGKLLKEFMERTNLTAVTLNAEHGIWTWQNRHNPDQRSVIDYVLASEGIARHLGEIIIDEDGELRLVTKHKTPKESDHNTITAKIYVKLKKNTIRIKKWNLQNKEGWENFNKEAAQAPTDTYDEFEAHIKRTLYKTIGKSTITVNKVFRVRSKKISTLRSLKRKKRKAFNLACKNNDPDKCEKLREYQEAQNNLRMEIEAEEKRRVLDNVNKIQKEGGAKSRRFWNTRKRNLGGKSQTSYNTITEEGRELTDSEETKEYIASFFEDLYKAREGKEEHEQITNEILNTVERLQSELESEREPDFSMEEMKVVVKQLKRNKSCGPDEMPNEIFIEANTQTLEVFRKIFNKILSSNNIPDQWQIGDITRLYKGKGTKGKCSNERGITKASNIGKFFERLVNNRAKDRVTMSDNQAGGKKGRATEDHIIVLKQLLQINKNEGKPSYISFFDVTKAYDKAWCDGILYVLHKNGLATNLWNTIRNLNSKLRATISTKFGATREIQIKDSIRQGGVLSVLMYALLMDEISKEITARNLGVPIPNTNVKIGSLLWMDDLLKVSQEPEEMQKMMDITNEISGPYRIVYGEPKSKVMKEGRRGRKVSFNLGEMELKYTDKYKYLGQVLNDKGNNKDHIEEVKGKAEAAYQTAKLIAGNENFNGIEMEVFWELLTSCVVPTIINNGAALNLSTKEEGEMNRIFDSILKRTLMVPPSTPREVLYIETGFLDISTTICIRRVMTQDRLKRNPSDLVDLVLTEDIENGWSEKNKLIREKMKIEPRDIEGSRHEVKRQVQKKSEAYFKEKITMEGSTKSKVQHLLQGRNNWKPGIREEYMSKLGRDQASLIFKCRTRMLEVKNNFRGMHRDLLCRVCKQNEETQKHVLEECEIIHITNENIVTNTDVFSNDSTVLAGTATKVKKVMTLLTKK